MRTEVINNSIPIIEYQTFPKQFCLNNWYSDKHHTLYRTNLS